MNSQFKFKPDKIKYLSNVDTLDSSHKKIIENINKKRDEVPKKISKLNELKIDLENLDNRRNEYSNIPNFISIRAKLIEDISCIEEELIQIENYEEETEYYSKTYQILFNYYDILDGQIENELKVNLDSSTKIQNNNDDIFDKNYNLVDDTDNLNYSEKKNNNNGKNNNDDNKDEDNKDENYVNSNSNSNYNPGDKNLLNDETNNDEKIKKNVDENVDENINENINENIDAWNFDGIEIFNSFKSSKLDILNEKSKMKRKEKKTTRKRVKNVESLIKDNNYNIFDFIHSNSKIDDSVKNIDLKKNIDSNSKVKLNEYDIYDRAILYEDYKTSLEGYSFKKNNSKPCINCGIDKILIYSEGIYACMKCGEVENCIVESEIANYKDPMVEKPTFPYKRKNHFCEWIIFALLVKVIIKNNGYSSSPLIYY